VVGTSSWADAGFVEQWYPPEVSPRDRLAYFAARFETVEVNASFYAMPEARTVARWAQVTPAAFSFDVKLHRLLSRHGASLDAVPPDLRDAARTSPRGRVVLDRRLERALLERTLEVFEPLRAAGKLGAFLLQLAPSFTPYEHRLAELEPIVQALAPHPVAIELRRRSWVREDRAAETLRWFEAVGAAFVGVDVPAADAPTIMPPLDAVTRDDLAYMRAHGRNAEGYLHGRSVEERFGYLYRDDELHEIAARLQELAATAALVKMHFNNNSGTDAPSAARRLREILGQDAGPPPVPAQQRLL